MLDSITIYEASFRAGFWAMCAYSRSALLTVGLDLPETQLSHCFQLAPIASRKTCSGVFDTDAAY